MSSASFAVLKPGIHTLIQDAGRKGHYGIGLSTSGPADRLSFMWANRLCGNRENTAALEVISGGLSLKSNCQTRIAVTGAPCPLKINGIVADAWTTQLIRPGDHIEVGYAATGTRCYLAVANGFQLPKIFGSTSTSEREHIGGIAGGRALKKNDALPVLPETDEDRFVLPASARPSSLESTEKKEQGSVCLRIIPAWQYRDIPRSVIKEFFSTTYSLSTTSNRMGYRLEGPPISSFKSGSMISEGIVPGAIQLPPNGLPIIMHVEHQTIGGYPKLGNLARVDLWLLAQLPLQTKVRFKLISRHSAENLLRRTMARFETTSPLRLL